MSEITFEVRHCVECGLRYPLVEKQSFGTRCPACLAETKVVVSKKLNTEPTQMLMENSSISANRRVSVLLDNIRSAWNVGSIFRTAEGFGFAHAYLCGITPTPENDSVQKTSLGAEDSVPWSYHKDAVRLIKGLKVQGWTIYGLEDSERATNISRITQIIPARSENILIAGNEVTGIEPGLLDLCDDIFHIPMSGAKKSFNVAVAFGIAAYALRAA